MPNEILHGDCLDILPEIPAASFDAVITDPPYMIGAVSVGNSSSKAGTWADMENSAYWFSVWFGQCRRVLRPTGYLCVFGNWRSLPTLIRALSLCHLSATSCLVWDKAWIGPAAPCALRPRWELVLLAAMPEGRIPDRAAADVHAVKWMAGNMRTTEHPAEKPVDLLRHHTGTTRACEGVEHASPGRHDQAAVAAVLEGLSFLGVERELRWVEVATQRVGAATATPGGT